MLVYRKRAELEAWQVGTKPIPAWVFRWTLLATDGTFSFSFHDGNHPLVEGEWLVCAPATTHDDELVEWYPDEAFKKEFEK